MNVRSIDVSEAAEPLSEYVNESAPSAEAIRIKGHTPSFQGVL